MKAERVRRFKLQNGLEAVLHPSKSHRMDQLFECIIDEPQLNQEKLFAVEVNVEGESVYLIYWSPYNPEGYVVSELQKKPNLLGFNTYIICNGTAYSRFHPFNHALINAVTQKLKPSLAVLVEP